MEEHHPLTRGIDHVGLTVADIDLSRRFFVECLGWKVVGEKPDYPAVFVSDDKAVLTLWQVNTEDGFVAFDRRRNIGLHHLALKVDSEEDLREVFARVSAWPGVEVEFAPEQVGAGAHRHAMVREPGGARLEFRFSPLA